MLGDRELWLMGPNGEQARKLYEMDDKKCDLLPLFLSEWTASLLRHQRMNLGTLSLAAI